MPRVCRSPAVIGWVVPFALATACSDTTAPVPRAVPRITTLSRSTSAVAPAVVTFRPPLAPDASAPSAIDPSANPTVDVCVVDSDGGCRVVVARFTFGTGERDVRIDGESQQYVANWKTKQCVEGACTLSTEPRYRIRVRTASRGEIGAIDVQLVDGGARKSAGSGPPTFQNGSTVPIKFWIAKTSASSPSWIARAASPVTGGLRVSAVYAAEDDAVYAAYGFPNHSSPFTVWRLALTTDNWSAIPTTGLPAGLQTRRIVHDPVRHELLTFVEGLGPVWAVAETGGTWHELAPYPSSSSYNEPAAFWHPVAQRLAFFGGYGFFTWHDELWSYDRASASWGRLDQSALRPMPRFADEVGVDETRGAVYIGGGQGYPTGRQFDGAMTPNDVWRLDFATNAWAQVLSNDPTREPTYIGAALDVIPESNALYRFGGLAPMSPNLNGSVWEVHADPATARNVLERLDLTAPASGWHPVVADGAPPSPRWSGGLFYDAPRHRLLVVGGQSPSGALLDVYALTLP